MKLQVEYMSFSAHADAKGIMQLIRMAEPRSVLLVHGEAAKMDFLKGKIEQEFSEWAAPPPPPSRRRSWSNPFPPAGVDCYMPANGETTTVGTNPSVPVDISLHLLKREMALGGASGSGGAELSAQLALLPSSDPHPLLPAFQGHFLTPRSPGPCTGP